MEEELSLNLLRCAQIYAAAKGMELSTLARLSAGDWRFFSNLQADGKTFTARKYDHVIQWFSDRWPSDKDWPVGIPRPEPASLSDPEPCGGSV
jgi:hypothetical protein